MLAQAQLTTTGSISFISQVNSDAQAILVKALLAMSKLRDKAMCVPALSGTKNWHDSNAGGNRVGGQSFVYVVEEDKSKENRNLWCIKNL